MSVSRTSVDASYAMVAGGALTDGQERVLAAFRRNLGREYTRAELEIATGLRTGTICGRVFELVRDGMIEERPRRTCAVTGEPAHALRLAKVQADLFAA